MVEWGEMGGHSEELLGLDMVLPVQFESTRGARQDSPVKRLHLAVLEQAIEDFRKHLHKSSRPPEWWEAYRWLFDDSTHSLNKITVTKVTEVANVDLDKLREELNAQLHGRDVSGAVSVPRRSPRSNGDRHQVTAGPA